MVSAIALVKFTLHFVCCTYGRQAAFQTTILSKMKLQAGEGVIHMKLSTAINYNTNIHADCLDILPQLPEESVDFILTDPPYLANYTDRDGRSIINDNNDAWLKP